MSTVGLEKLTHALWGPSTSAFSGALAPSRFRAAVGNAHRGNQPCSSARDSEGRRSPPRGQRHSAACSDAQGSPPLNHKRVRRLVSPESKVAS